MKKSHRMWLYDELIGLADSLDDHITYFDAIAGLTKLAAEVVDAFEEAGS